MRMTASIRSGSPAMKSARAGMPALLTSSLICGCRSVTRAASASTAARSATSQISASAPSSSASARRRSSPRATRTQRQPRRVRSRGRVAPIPLEPPVITAMGFSTRSSSATRARGDARAPAYPRGLDSPAVSQDRFKDRRALVLGVANKRSIAWGIARRLADGGARLAFTYQGDRIESGVRELAETVQSPLVTACDVRSDDDVARVFAEVADTFDGSLDILVHSVAYAAAEDLEGRFTDTPRDRFWLALDVSAYSLVGCARAAEPLMEAAGGGSIL